MRGPDNTQRGGVADDDGNGRRAMEKLDRVIGGLLINLSTEAGVATGVPGGGSRSNAYI